ncbi:MAG: tetratricopeptide repeat protein [Nitrospira sp.]|nr:tetratricopeptide repeat protein [Nitrospira sp.]
MRPLKPSMSLIAFTILVSLPGLGQAQFSELPAINRCRAEIDTAHSRSSLYQIWLQRAAQNNALACFCLSYTPSDKENVPLAWLEQAAKLRLPDAQLLMGANYEVGLNFQQDFNQAMFWYREAANQDFPYAQYELASIYFEGRAGQTRNAKEALFWGRLAARHQFHSVDELIEKSKTQLNREDIQTIEQEVSKWVARRIRQTGKS